MGETTPKKVEEAVRQTNIFLRKLLWTLFLEIGRAAGRKAKMTSDTRSELEGCSNLVMWKF